MRLRTWMLHTLMRLGLWRSTTVVDAFYGDDAGVTPVVGTGAVLSLLSGWNRYCQGEGLGTLVTPARRLRLGWSGGLDR